MSRSFLRPGVVTATAVLSVLPAVADDSYTTRIEPRNVYGATVTIEEGVRVFRPLPSERQVIVNPGGMTPLTLGFFETRIKEESTNNNNFYDNSDTSPYVGDGCCWGGPFVGRRPFIGHGPGFRHFGGM